MRKISTNLTFFWRLFVIAWISYFLIAGTYGIYDFLSSSNRSFSGSKIIIFIIFGLVSSGFVNFIAGTLKNVFIVGDNLVISNFVKQIQVPFSEISHVDNPDRTSLRRIKIVFHQPSEFGKEIVFSPCIFEGNKIAKLLKSKIQTNYLSL